MDLQDGIKMFRQYTIYVIYDTDTYIYIIIYKYYINTIYIRYLDIFDDAIKKALQE